MLKLKFLLPSWLVFYVILFFPSLASSWGSSYVDYKYFSPVKLAGFVKVKGRSDFYRVSYNAKFLINKVEKFLKGKKVNSWSYEYLAGGLLKRCSVKKGWKVHSYYFNKAGDVERESYCLGKRFPHKTIEYSYADDKLEMKRFFYYGKLRSFYRYTYFLASGFYMETQFTGGIVTRNIYYRINDSNQVVEELHYSYGRLRKIYVLKYYSFGFLKSKRERKITKMDAKINPFKEDVERARP